jgi:hypothetical protein
MNKSFYSIALGVLAVHLATAQVIPPNPKTKQPPIQVGKDGKLVYNTDAQGNKVPDFSTCGYMGADAAIPEVSARVVVQAMNGDATSRIQSALDYVATLPLNEKGIRGAVLLSKGTFEVNGQLLLKAPGVILRGSGMGEDGTILFAVGTDRETFIHIGNAASVAAKAEQIGIENLRCRSAYEVNNPKDEAHRWMAIVLENVKDAWVRRVVFEHFAGSAVCVLATAERITVEDCKSLAPVSEIGGQRRNTFYTIGKQILFQRLYAERGYHDFAVGYSPWGSNAFVQCEAHLPYSYSGTIEKTASNVLFDIVTIDGNALGFPYNSLIEKEAGPGVRNSVLWQCSAAKALCFQPEGGGNWAFGVWATFEGNGSWYDCNEHIKPRSLYYAQLTERIGQPGMERANVITFSGAPTTSPTYEMAAKLIAEAYEPNVTMSDWIDKVDKSNPIDINTAGIKTIEQTGFKEPIVPAKPAMIMSINNNGWIVCNGKVVTGGKHHIKYWTGNLTPMGIGVAKPHITRWVPGRTGTGLTDDLQEVANWMDSSHIVALDHNYGLWYDRRRDDHERIRRMDGDVKAPFYELPFARSGQDTAFDGLSKYDLTKYNTWYWKRLNRFAQLADEKGLVLLHENYFQHNILEAGGHYADYPWRTANNINHTPFPEPVNYAEDKRIFIAQQYYTLTNPAYRELHRAYIRKCLDNFSTNHNVIQLIGAEYTGPLHFVNFWVDVIKEWEQEHHATPFVALSTTKDVQDSLLADPSRADLVNIINIRFWYYQFDGSLYAPKGGVNLSPRQHARQLRPKPTSFAQAYRGVQEYHSKYPGKAIMCTIEDQDEQDAAIGWAVFMAGGSLADIPVIKAPGFLNAAATMKPLAAQPAGQYALANENRSFIIYCDSSAHSAQLDLTGANKNYTATWIDPVTGNTLQDTLRIKGGKKISIPKPAAQHAVLWVREK